MATLKEYFDSDFNCLAQHTNWSMENEKGEELEPIFARIINDLAANAKYWTFYLSGEIDVEIYTNRLFQTEEVNNCVLGKDGDVLIVQMGFVDYPERALIRNLNLYTSNLFLY